MVNFRTIMNRTHAQLSKYRPIIYGNSFTTNNQYITKNINDATAVSIKTYTAAAEISEIMPGLLYASTTPISAAIIAEAIENHYSDIVRYVYGIYRACMYAVNNTHSSLSNQMNRINRDYEEVKNFMNAQKSLEMLVRFVKNYDNELPAIEI